MEKERTRTSTWKKLFIVLALIIAAGCFTAYEPAPLHAADDCQACHY